MSQQTYLVNKQRRLVDLNGDSTNFDLTFTCTSQNHLPFEILVVDQTTLDASPNLQYKKANGIISGNIVADKNVYQNYFLVLRADNPCQVVVKTVKKEIPPKLHQPAPARAPARAPATPLPVRGVTAQPKCKWKTIALVIVVVGGGALLYYLYKKGKTSPPSVNAVTVPSLEVHVPPAASTASPLGSGAIAASTASSLGSGAVAAIAPLPSGGLLDRLKNLPI